MTQRILITILTLLICFFSLQAAVQASDMLIVEKQRIGPILLMMDRSTVERILGKPSSEKSEEGAVLLLKYDREGFVIAMRPLRANDLVVTDITTRNSGYKTSRGIHPGSTLRELTAAYGRNSKVSTYKGITYHRYTDLIFEITGNKVTAVSISNISL